MVAVKTLNLHKDLDRQRKEYKRELKNLATLHHEALLPLIDCKPFEERKAPIATQLMHCSVEQLIDGVELTNTSFSLELRKNDDSRTETVSSIET
jgi:hypothetical protein